jgi:uncharacterized protein (DUF3820 family)
MAAERYPLPGEANLFTLSDSEFQPLRLLPEADIADLAVELDMVPEAEIDARGLLSELVGRILDRAVDEGLPFSKYDADDLRDLPEEHFRALADKMGWPADVPAFLKLGGKIYKEYQKTRRNSQVAIMLPLLLPALARHAYEK